MTCGPTNIKPPYVGDERTFTARWRFKGEYVDPDVVIFTVTDPSANVTSYTYNAMGSPIVRAEEGVYTLDVSFTLAGRWTVVASATGAGQAVDVRSVMCLPVTG